VSRELLRFIQIGYACNGVLQTQTNAHAMALSMELPLMEALHLVV
jgi:hypothetical protein